MAATRTYIVQCGAKRTHVIQIIITLFIFNIKKIMSPPKQPVINAVLITYIDYSFTENYIACRRHVRSLSSNFCITFTKISCGTVAISSRMETFRSSTVRGFRKYKSPALSEIWVVSKNLLTEVFWPSKFSEGPLP